ncbi:MAG: DnaJ domain-containing protein [Terracidiphilus sp.]
MLGFTYGVPTEPEIQEAYKEAVKQWHPDLFENYASLRADAEERFKQIQVAFRELNEHNSVGVESPAEGAPAAGVATAGVAAQSVPEKPEELPYIAFGGATGCLNAGHFTPEAEAIVARHLGKLGAAVAIVDLGGVRAYDGSFSQFLLLGTRGSLVRDARNMMSLLWHTDLGEIKLIDRGGSSNPGGWQKLVKNIAGQPKPELQIYRSNGVPFLTIANQVEDGVATAIYEFLARQKAQAKP